MVDSARDYQIWVLASRQERAAAQKRPLWVKRGASQNPGHHLCKDMKVGGRERAGAPRGWLLGGSRWASSCGWGCSPPPLHGGRGTSWLGPAGHPGASEDLQSWAGRGELGMGRVRQAWARLLTGAGIWVLSPSTCTLQAQQTSASGHVPAAADTLTACCSDNLRADYHHQGPKGEPSSRVHSRLPAGCPQWADEGPPHPCSEVKPP